MTNSTIQTLTKLIIHAALNERPSEGLLIAYTEEFSALCDEEGEDGLDVAAEIDAVESADDCEQLMAAEFTRNYKAALDHEVSDETCLEVFEYPRTLPSTKVPRRILQLIGREMARRDASMANAVRRQVLMAQPLSCGATE
jgi:hypothetical protein